MEFTNNHMMTFCEYVTWIDKCTDFRYVSVIHIASVDFSVQAVQVEHALECIQDVLA